MRFANEHDITDYVIRFRHDDTPNLFTAANTLYRLMCWTNENSDGWPYWQKPARAAQKLVDLCESVDRFYRGDPRATDVSDADLKRALVPVKAFLTRQRVPHQEIIS